MSKIIITTATNQSWQDFVNSLENDIETMHDINELTENAEANLLFCLQKCSTFDGLNTAINQRRLDTVVVFYQQAEYAIFNALNLGVSLDEAAHTWLNNTKALLEFHRQNRRNVKLINLEQALANPTCLSQQLVQHGVNLSVGVELTTPPSLALLLACQHVRQSTALIEENTLLSASSLPLVKDENLEFDINLLLSDIASRNNTNRQLQDDVEKSKQELLKQHDELTEITSKLMTTEQENSELNQRLNQGEVDSANLHEAIKSLQLAVEDKEKNVIEAQCEIERKNNEVITFEHELNQQIANNTKTLADAESESTLFQLQLAQLQEELEKHYVAFTNEKKARAELELNYEEVIKDKTKLIDSFKQEKELFLLQLLQVQEELEKCYADFTNEQSKRVEKENECEHLINNNQVTCHNLNQENELLMLQLAQVQEELETFYLHAQTIQKELKLAKNEYQQLNEKHAALERKTRRILKNEKDLQGKLNELSAAEKSKSDHYAQSLQQLKIKELELAKLTSQYDKAKGEIVILKHQLQQSGNEIEGIKSSALWKSAEPVRKLARVVQKVDKKRAKLQQDIGLLLTSEYFDAQWYIDTYPDVAASNVNPAEHYLKFGAKEGRFPSPKFDGKWYLQRYPDIASADVNPLIHFIKFGISEGRSASPTLLTNQQQNTKRR